ncbi:MAG: DHH family phosphoesterase [Methanobacteriota archaeon]|nr:MAG: DHH family phosphoesterase [Euryarchaeota archaeon]
MTLEQLKVAVERVKALDEKSSVLLVGHDDADGLTAGAITYKAMLREGFTPHLRCVKRVDRRFLEEIAAGQQDLVVFSDSGSGQLPVIAELLLGDRQVIVLDHHEPVELEHENLCHVNPHLEGVDGAREISGAGVSYLFARELDSRNRDMAHLAVIGALGDVQDAEGTLKGLNREIAEDAVEGGLLKIEKDLRFFGRQTRPLYKAIEYTTEPFIPGLSGNESACVQFLSDLGIPAKKNGEFTKLADLDEEEKKRLTTALILKMIEHKMDVKTAESIVGDVYTVLAEEKRTILRDAKEYTSLLNACGRYERYGVGVGICLGDRGEVYEQALTLLEEHKRHISSCYEWINENLERIRDAGSVYAVHAHKELSENVIGTVASMIVNSRLLNPVKPVVAFADTADGEEVKVSSRATKELVDRGLNLGEALRYAAEKTGGEGGGHDIAAGAQVKHGAEDEFLRFVNEKVGEQLNGA